MVKLGLTAIVILLLSAFNQINCKEGFYLDAIVFQSHSADSARIDVYLVIPYETLTFESVNNKFVSNIDINVRISDKSNQTVGLERTEKTVLAENYKSSQGAKAEFLKLFYQFQVAAGNYTVEAEIKDEFSNNKAEKKRDVTAIEFNKYPFSLSGILLLSQIEEIDGKYRITPFVSDNVGVLEDKFFAFFEIYNTSEPKEIELSYTLKKSEEVETNGEYKSVTVPVGKSQNFLNVDLSELTLSGEYMLQVIAYEKTETGERKIIAISQRSIKHNENSFSVVEKDIDKAIRMLRYVATDAQIEKIENEKTVEMKRERFNDFWRELDPTPNTAFNEAKEEYFQRIKYANEQFKSYTEGWLTDMGMVFIVMGPPMQVDKQTSFGNNIEYRQWQYGSNRTFLFADKNGFGNFRLERPYLFNEKYRYKK